jgi:hypothetical protein
LRSARRRTRVFCRKRDRPMRTAPLGLVWLNFSDAVLECVEHNVTRATMLSIARTPLTCLRNRYGFQSCWGTFFFFSLWGVEKAR